MINFRVKNYVNKLLGYLGLSRLLFTSHLWNVSIFFLFSRYSFTLFNFLIILLVASILDIADFGKLMFFRLISQYLLYSEFGFIQYIFRKRSESGSISNEDLGVVLIYLSISITIFLLAFLSIELTYGVFLSNQLYVFYALISVIFGISSKLVIDQLRIKGDTKNLIFIEFISNLIVYLVVGYCWLNSITSLDFFVGAYALSLGPYFLFILFSSVFHKKIKVIKFNLVLNKNIIYGSSMLFLYGVLSLGFMSIDRIIIKYYFGYESLGLYSIAYSISLGVYMVVQAITWLNMSKIIKTISNNSREKSKKKFKEYILKVQFIYFVTVVFSIPIYYYLMEYGVIYKDTLYIYVFLLLYNYIGIHCIYNQAYLVTFELYKELNILIFLFLVCGGVLGMVLQEFNRIEILIIGSVGIHLLYMLAIRQIVNSK